MRPIDIVDVKAGINAGRLYVAVKGKYLLLGDFQTGESVRLSDIEVKPVVHARWKNVPHVQRSLLFFCSKCGTHSHFKTCYCSRCGAQMDGESDDDSC